MCRLTIARCRGAEFATGRFLSMYRLAVSQERKCKITIMLRADDGHQIPLTLLLSSIRSGQCTPSVKNVRSLFPCSFAVNPPALSTVTTVNLDDDEFKHEGRVCHPHKQLSELIGH
jgi:hypothetical protein